MKDQAVLEPRGEELTRLLNGLICHVAESETIDRQLVKDGLQALIQKPVLTASLMDRVEHYQNLHQETLKHLQLTFKDNESMLDQVGFYQRERLELLEKNAALQATTESLETFLMILCPGYYLPGCNWLYWQDVISKIKQGEGRLVYLQWS